MISSEDCYAIWAPEDSMWAQWAKPVMFASVPGLVTDAPFASVTLDVPGLPEGWNSTAVVLDLASEESVAVGLAFAQRGFRPVPLYNGTAGPNPVVKTDALVAALGAGSQMLKTFAIKPDARPVFLLDSNRRGTMGAVSAGQYDNRWVVLPQDLPSATFLLSQGVENALLVQRGVTTPREDLAHVLLRWQQAGIGIAAIDLDKKTVVEHLTVTEPSLFRKTWYAAIALMGLRRSNVGGFGSVVPEQTARSGFSG
jgi:hypothetical protein